MVTKAKSKGGQHFTRSYPENNLGHFRIPTTQIQDHFIYLVIPKIKRFSLFSLSGLLLILAGDVELNPGPNMFQTVVQGHFHQGDTRFGETAGIQCTC